MQNKWILPVLIFLLFLMFASNVGILTSSKFLSNLCVKCNQNNCWPTLGLIMNAVLFLILLFLILRTYTSEGFCDMGPMNEDGTFPSRLGADGEPICTDEQREAGMLRMNANAVEVGRGSKAGLTRIVRGRRTDGAGQWLDDNGDALADDADPFTDAGACVTADVDGFGTDDENLLCQSLGLSDAEHEVLTACMFRTLTQEEDERCDEIVPEIAAALEAGEDVSSDALAYFDMCKARGSDSCAAFDQACADAFGGLSTCMSGAEQPGGSFGDGGFCRCG